MLLTPFLCLALVSQDSPFVLPEPGTSAAFQATVQRTLQALDAGDFATAKALTDVLPVGEFTVAWDESGLPPELRTLAREARDRALASWRSLNSVVRPSLAKPGDKPNITISFVPDLPADPDTGLPQGAVYFVSDEPSEPRVEGLIALTRGETKVDLHPQDVESEVLYAIGAYLGLERSPRPGGAMGRSDLPIRMRVTPLGHEYILARANVEITHRLKRAVEKRERLKPAKPSAFIETTVIRPAPALQGDLIPMSFQITNSGDAPLRFAVIADCSCFSSVEYSGTAPAGGTALVKAVIDSTHYPGDLVKGLYVYTNDPETAVRRVTVLAHVDPAYRLISESNRAVVLVGPQGAEETFYLIRHEKRSFAVKDVAISGGEATATFEPWSGTIQDRQGANVTGAGYKVSLKISASQVPGRSPLAITLNTDDPVFKQISRTVPIQSGIVAMPASVYFGEVDQTPRKAWFLVSRPGTTFNVTKVESDSDAISADVARQSNGDFKVTVQFSGKAPFGNFNSTLKVHTDDPAQPVILVSVSGVVR